MTISLTKYLQAFIKLRGVLEKNNPLRLPTIDFKNKADKKKYDKAWTRYLKAKKKLEKNSLYD